MKLQISFLFLLLSLNSTGQGRVFFRQSDSCRQFSKELGKDSILTMRMIDRCKNYSVIEQVTFDKGMYSRNGTYSEFYDTSFKIIKKQGFFLNGIETGNWKEFYINGKLKCEGSCKVIKVANSTLDPKKIWIIDIQKLDTTHLSFNFSNLDSIKGLTQYNYYPPFESKGYMLPEFYSLKNGTWYYYSDKGVLTKKEVYKVGLLISN